MKKYLLVSCLSLILAITSFLRLQSQVVLAPDSIVMGPSYANEVYYSMQNGVVSTFPRDSWDIAFRTMVMSSSIITNDGKNVMLYTYPNADTSGWASVDTAGLQLWKPLYNGVDDWENGAFMRNATGGLDFGWGVYNTANHYITGDSLYVIQLRDGSLRKLWIIRKKAAEDIYTFRYAMLDGANEHSVTLNCTNYLAKEFIGYSLEADSVVDYQPDRESWDLVFTKYVAPYSPDTVYNYMGIENNALTYTQEFLHVAPDFIAYKADSWDSTKIGIGHDWKTFDNSIWTLTDSLAYFVKTQSGEIYKLVMTKYEGSGTGKVGFDKAKVPGLGIADKRNSQIPVSVFPTPATDRVHLRIDAQDEASGLEVLDLTGRTVFTDRLAPGADNYLLDSSSLRSGVYFLKVTSGNKSAVVKVIISR
jgi:hypothetical protein